MGFSFLSVSSGHSESGIGTIQLNKPERSNAMNSVFFSELPRAIEQLDEDPFVRVITLSGSGKNFTSGMDVSVLASLLQEETSSPSSSERAAQDPSLFPSSSMKTTRLCPGRKRESLRRGIRLMQDAISSIETCRKPVIAAIQGACIGGGIDLITACDIRYCAASAYFCVKEVDLAIVADLGTLQRLPRIVGEGNARELALTARVFGAEEAFRMGLVQGLFSSNEILVEKVQEIAQSIAKKSPLAVVGTKHVMNFSRDHSVSTSLDFTATWNAAMLLSDDVPAALNSSIRKMPPTFSKL